MESYLISIHAPREGGDEAARADLVNWKLISIHAPREGGDKSQRVAPPIKAISIHAPREGGDFHDDLIRYTDYISIHAPREGGDTRRTPPTGPLTYFNPRPPRGGATLIVIQMMKIL